MHACVCGGKESKTLPEIPSWLGINKRGASIKAVVSDTFAVIEFFAIFPLTFQSSLFKCFPLLWHALGVLLHEHFYVPPEQ